MEAGEYTQGDLEIILSKQQHRRWQFRCSVGWLDEDLIQLLKSSTFAIEDIVGNDRFYSSQARRHVRKQDTIDPTIAAVTPLAVLTFGSASAYITLVTHGYEREATLLQRQIIELYVRVKYYSENRRAAEFDTRYSHLLEELRFLDGTYDERGTLKAKGAKEQFGSLRRPTDIKRRLTEMWPEISNAPASDITEAKFSRQFSKVRAEAEVEDRSFADLAGKYCLGDNDYALYYALPSKMTHGSHVAKLLTQSEDRLMFSGSMESALRRVCVVVEYLIEFADVLSTIVEPKAACDSAAKRRKLAILRRRLNVFRPSAPKARKRSRQSR